MARSISYFIFSSNGSYLRWDDDPAIGFAIHQYQMSITGGSDVDRLYAGANTQVDATGLFASAGVDQLYLSGNFADYSGNFADYTQTVSSSGVYTFTGVAGGAHAGEVLSFSMTSSGDQLVFADRMGVVQLSTYLNIQTNSFAFIQSSQLTAGVQPNPASGAVPGNAASKVFVFDSGGINIPQLPIAGEAVAITGGSGVDSFYVRRGTHADATGLFASAGIDALYLTGKFADYTQTVSTGGVYTFTRHFMAPADVGLSEVVSFSLTSSGDKLVFADGGATLQLSHYLSGSSFAIILAADLDRTTVTPGVVGTPSLSLASDTGASASDSLTNNPTINVTGLALGTTWQYQVDGTAGAWQMGTGASFNASTGTHSYFVRQIDAAGNTSAISSVVSYTLDTSAPSGITSVGTSANVAENSLGAVTLTANANDLAANASVTWSLGTGGDNALFNLTSGVLSFKKAPNFELPRGSAFNAVSNNNTYTVNVIATDAAGNASTQAISVTVTDLNENPVALGTVPNQTATQDVAYSFNVGGYFSDPDILDTGASSNHWGVLTYTTSNTLPSGLSLDSATGIISGTATAPTTAASITVTATDGDNVFATQTFSLGVVNGAVVSSFTVSDSVGNVNFGKESDLLTFTVTLSEAVTLDTTGGTPSLTFNINGQTVTASYAGGTGSSTLTFTTSAPTGNGNSISLSAIQLNGATAVSTASSARHWETTIIGQTYAGYTVNNTTPMVSRIALTAATDNAPLSTATPPVLGAGDVLTLTVTFSEAVTVSGTPQLDLLIGTATVQASYVAPSPSPAHGSSSLVFTYVILSGQTDSNGISIPVNALTGGTIQSLAGTSAILTASAVADNASYLVDTIAVTPSLTLARDTGMSASDKITANPTINVSGLEAGASWQYQVDGTAAGSWVTGSGNSFTASNGAHSYFVQQTDLAGNTSAISNAVSYTLDTSAPVTPSLTLARDTGMSASDNITTNPTINVGGLEANATWQYQVDSTAGAWITGSGNSFTASSGAHSYFVQQIDLAGNTSAPSSAVGYTLNFLSAGMNLAEVGGVVSGLALLGEAAGDQSGISVAGIGDINGDGYADFMVGAWLANGAAGKSYVLLGKASWGGVSSLNLSTIAAGSGGFALMGAAQSGYSVSAAGDINGDGYADFMVGAIGGTGKSYVVLGKADWNGVSSLNLSTIAAGSGGFVLVGEASGDQSGISIAALGDINSDGYADFMVGANKVNGSAGKSYVVLGKADWNGVSSLNLSTIAAGSGGFAVLGESAGDQSGYSVSSVGDLNGDGYADFMVGAHKANGSAGKSYVVFGKANWNGVSSLSLSTIAAGTGGFALAGENAAVAGISTGDRSGASVSAAGDLNGDGYADLIIGANNAYGGAGKSYVVFGKASWNGVSTLNLSTIAAGSGGFALLGENAPNSSGYSVSAAGDINGDGYADLIIGANNAYGGAGRSYVVFGKANWSGVSTLNLNTIAAGTGGFAVQGESVDDFSGASVSAAGDINGDGYADLMIGAYGAAVGANNLAGKSYVIFGAPSIVQASGGVLVQASAGVATGSAANEMIVGSSGADTLSGGGGVDRFFGGAGDDIIVLTASDTANLVSKTATVLSTVDGGTGIDTLRLTGGASLDLTAIANIAVGTPLLHSRIASIERIDLRTDTAANALTLGIGDVLDLAGLNSFNTGNGWANGTGTALGAANTIVQKHQLVIDGLATDVVNLQGAWSVSQTVSGSNDTVTHRDADQTTHTYTVYKSDTGNAQLLIEASVTVTLSPRLSLASDTGISHSDNITGNPTILVSGVLSGNTWQYQVDGGTWITGNGNSFMASSGAHSYAVQQISAAGNTSAPSSAVGYTLNILSAGVSLAEVGGAVSGLALLGEAAGDQSGISVAGIGDINGDGYADFMVGAWLANRVAGKSYVVLGKASWGGVSSLNLSTIAAGSGGFVLIGALVGTSAAAVGGISVAGIGDINGDGYADFMVGAWLANGVAGKNYVVLGKADWNGVSSLNLSTIAAGSGGFALLGEAASDQSGISVAGIGDINGDGYADLIIGANNANGVAGKSYVVFGRASWSGVSTLNLSTIAAGSGGFALVGEVAGDQSGYSVSSAGDINGDGYVDFIIGAQYANGNAGKSYVVFGRASWSGVSRLNLSAIAAGSGGFALTGEAQNDWSGTSIAPAGDINGDGYADFIISAQNANGNAGKSYVVFGRASWSGVSSLNLSTIAAGSGGFALVGENAQDSSGYSVASIGDFNGDGYADFMVGARNANGNAGKSYVVFGRASWSGVSSLSLRTIAAGTGGFVLVGEVAGDQSGVVVAPAGDINGDGYADLLIGASTTIRNDAGKSYVIFGGPNLVQASGTLLVQASAGVATGSAANEMIVGSKDADTLTGGGGVDRFFGGAGDDIIILTASDIANLVSKTPSNGVDGVLSTVDGGTGIDTLRLTGGASLDLTTIVNIAVGDPLLHSRIANIERIDLRTDTSANTLTLSASDVLNLAGLNSFNTGNGWTNGTGMALGAVNSAVAKHQLLIDGLATDVLNLQGLWSVSQTAGINDTVTHRDGDGTTHSYNVYNSLSGNVQLLSDASVTVTLSPRLSLASDTGISASDNITGNPTINVSDVLNGNTWQYQVDGGTWLTGSGASFIATEGAHSYFVRQIDSQNHISAVGMGSYTVNTTAPFGLSLSLLRDSGSSASDRITNSATIKVSGFVSGSTWQYQVDGTSGTWLTASGATFTATSGTHSYFVRQTDTLFGNVSVSSAVFTLATTPPTISGASTFNFTGNSSAPVTTLTASANVVSENEPSTLRWALVSGGDSAWFNVDPASGTLRFNSPPSYETPRGAPFNASTNNDAYHVTVSATDVAGNVSTTALTINVSEVNKAPLLVAPTPTQTIFIHQPFTLNIASAFSDPNTLSTTLGPASLRYFATGLPDTFYISSDGTIRGTATSEANGVLAVTAVDGGGLSVSQTFNWSVIPATILNGVFQGGGPLIAGSGLSVQAVDSAGKVLAVAPIQDNGAYSLNLGSKIGVVRLQVLDNNGATADFYDQTLVRKSAGSGAFGATVVIDSVDVHTVNINALTSLAAKALGENSDSGLVNTANQWVAQYCLGLNNTDITSVNAQLTIDVAANGDRSTNANANLAGQVLAFFSAAEQLPQSMLANTQTVLSSALASGQADGFNASLQNLYAQAGARLHWLTSSNTGMSADNIDTVARTPFPVNGVLIYARQDVLTEPFGNPAVRFKFSGRVNALRNLDNTLVSLIEFHTFAPLVSRSNQTYGVNPITVSGGAFPSNTSTASNQLLVMGNNAGITWGEWNLNVTATSGVVQIGVSPNIKINYAGVTSGGERTYTISANNFTFTLGTPIPVLDLDQDNGTSGSDGLTSNKQVKVYKLMGGTSTWQYQVDGGTWQAGTGNAFNLSPGTHNYSVRQINGTDTSSASSPVTYTLGSPPTLSLASDSGASPNDNITNNPTIVVGSLAGATWQYQVDGSVWDGWQNGSGTSFTASSGAHSYFVRQTSSFYGTSTVSMASYTLDTSAPLIPTLQLASDNGSSATDGLTSNPTINVTGLEDGATWQYRVDGGSWMSGAGSSFTASSGAHSYFVRQTDKAGNNSAASGEVVFTLSQAPLSNIFLSDVGNGSGGFVLNSSYTQSSTAVGDVNGDGYADLLVSGYQTGAVSGLKNVNNGYLVFGKTDTSAVDLGTVANGSGGFALNGQQNDHTMSALGDMNGDGLADFIIGSAYANQQNYQSNNYVVWGQRGTSAVNLSSVANGSGGFVINAPPAGVAVTAVNYLYSVSAGGDVNGDGLLDVLINWPAPPSSGPVTLVTFRTYVVLGKQDTSAVNLADVANGSGGFVINGPAGINGELHHSLAIRSVGDVNGDGLADLLIGIILTRENTRQYYLLFGKTDTSAVDLSAVQSGSGGFAINSPASFSHDIDQQSMSALGDVNGDGLADFMIGVINGTANQGYVVFGKADTSALNLSAIANGTGGFVINTSTTADSFALNNASVAGDVNGDGLADFILSNPEGSGATKVYVVFGKADGAAINLSDVASGRAGFVINGPANSVAGISVSAAGDVNGDGFADLLVNSRAGDYIVFGSAKIFNPNNVLVQGSGSVTGTAVSEAIVGGSGNDVLIGNGGSDRFFAGAGDDVIVLTQSNVDSLTSKTVTNGVLATVDGGAGIDTLRLSGGANLDLTLIANVRAGNPLIQSRIANIERVDLASDTTANTLTLEAADVLDMAASNSFNTTNGWANASGASLGNSVAQHQLAITGAFNDRLVVQGAWVQATSSGVADIVSGSDNGVSRSYHVYNSGLAQLLIDVNISPVLDSLVVFP